MAPSDAPPAPAVHVDALARRGARARARAQPDPAAPHVRGGLRDADLGVPQAARRRARVPAGVGRAGPRRALVVHRLQAPQRAALVARRPRRPVRARRSRRSRATARRRCRTCRRSPAGRSAASATTSCARSSRSASRTPIPSALPDLALMLTDVLVAFDHLRRELTILANVYADDEDLERSYAEAVEAIADVRRRLAGPVPQPAEQPVRRPRGARPGRATCRASSSRGWSSGSSSTSTPATPTRSSRASAGRRRCRSRRSRSTAGCAPSTRARTCTSSTSATSRSPARAPSRS